MHGRHAFAVAQEVIGTKDEEIARRKAAKRYPEIPTSDPRIKVRVSQVP